MTIESIDYDEDEITEIEDDFKGLGPSEGSGCFTAVLAVLLATAVIVAWWLS